VTTPALVFHTFVTTHLDDRALADVAAATLLALAAQLEQSVPWAHRQPDLSVFKA